MNAKRTFTAVKAASGQSRKFRSWADYSVGDVVLGKFLGSFPNQFDESKPNYSIEVLESFLKDKKAQKEITEGTILALNHTGMLHKALSNMEIGKIIQVTYNGSNTMEKGKFKGKSAHTMEVMEMVEDGASEESDSVDL
jgi:hypothetical protein